MLTKKLESQHQCQDTIYVILVIRILLWRETSLLIKKIFTANDFNAPDNTAANATATNNTNNKNNASFINCVSKINGLQIDTNWQRRRFRCCNANV